MKDEIPMGARKKEQIGFRADAELKARLLTLKDKYNSHASITDLATAWIKLCLDLGERYGIDRESLIPNVKVPPDLKKVHSRPPVESVSSRK